MDFTWPLAFFSLRAGGQEIAENKGELLEDVLPEEALLSDSESSHSSPDSATTKDA